MTESQSREETQEPPQRQESVRNNFLLVTCTTYLYELRMLSAHQAKSQLNIVFVHLSSDSKEEV